MPTDAITQPTLPQAPIKAFNANAPSTLAITPPAQPVVSPIQPQQSQAPVSQGTTATGLDPQAVALAQAIRQTESNGNFTAQGKSGEYGAYQWEPGTWATQSAAAGVNVPLEDATPAQQNQVAYTQIKQWKDAGYNVGQIASMWNAGAGDPDAYLNGNKGTNSSGVSYDTQAYAQKVATAYQQFKTQQPAQTPQTPATGANTTPGETFTGDLASGNYLGAAVKGAENVGNFAFPIASDLANDFEGTSTKGALQQLGDAGMSALWFLPFGGIADAATDVARAGLGLGEGAEATAGLVNEALPTAENAAKVASVAKTANTAKILGNVAAGLGTGYLGDVSSNLAQGQTGAGALKPGLGTVTGGVLGGALTAAGSFYNKFNGEQNVVDKVQQAYEDAAGSTKTGIKNMTKTASKGLDSNPEFLANAGILPETAEINGRRVFTTGADSASQKTIQGRITDLTNLRDEAITKAGQDTPMYLEDMRQQALDQANEEFAGTAQKTVADHINSEFDAYKTQFGDGKGNISLTDANEIKKDLQSKTNYDATRPSIITRANSMMANIAKSSVEDSAEKAGLPGVKALNKIIQQHLDSLKFLDKINGQTIKGGRIGKYVEGGVGAYIGSTVGNAVGGNIGGAVGTLAGGGAGLLLSKFLQKFASGGTVSAAAIGRMAQEDPEVVQNFLAYLGKNGEKIAPMLKPEAETGASQAQDLASHSPGDKIVNKISSLFDHQGAQKAGYTPEEIDDFLKTQE